MSANKLIMITQTINVARQAQPIPTICLHPTVKSWYIYCRGPRMEAIIILHHRKLTIALLCVSCVSLRAGSTDRAHPRSRDIHALHSIKALDL
jgi:hypothetical protein